MMHNVIKLKNPWNGELGQAEPALPRPVSAKAMADRSAAGSDLLPSFSRPQVFGELMFPDDAVVGLVRMADPILRLIGSMGEEGDDRVTSHPGPGRSVLGIADVLTDCVEVLAHQIPLLAVVAFLADAQKSLARSS